MPLTPEDEPTAAPVSLMAGELTELRRRGLHLVDGTSKQPPKEVPLLEAMAGRELVAARGPSTTMLGRSDLLAGFLGRALDAYAAGGQADAADFIRPLFFDPRQGIRCRASSLLDAARRASPLDDDAFTRRRQAVFLDFAGFLIGQFPTRDTEPPHVPDAAATPDTEHLAQDPVDPEVETPGRVGRNRRSLLIGAGVAVMLIGIAGAALALSNRGDDPGVVAAPTPATVPSASASIEVLGSGGDQRPPVMLTFDSLGGTSSTYISVFPGVTESAADTNDNGTYPHGETRQAICKTIGRTVTSDTSAGEEPRSYDVWILIDGTPGIKQYASLTYARIEQAELDTLLTCA